MAKRTAVKLTDTRVKAFKRKLDGPKTQYLWDSVEAGLGLTVTMHGQKSWMHRFNPPGKNKQAIRKIGEYPALSIEQAREKVRARKRVLYDGRDPRYTSDGEMTVEEWYEKYLKRPKYLGYAENTKRGFVSSMKRVLPIIGGLALNKVRPADVIDMVDRIILEGKEGAARQALANTQMLFSSAVNAKKLNFSPAVGVKPEYTKSGARTRYLDNAEIRGVMNLSNLDPVNLLLEFLLLTGCRITEARLMKWSDIDEEVMNFSDTKTDSHSLPVCGLLEGLLSRAKRLSGRREYVFASLRVAGSPICDTYVRVRLREIGGDLTPHTLRHTVATGINDTDLLGEFAALVLNHAVAGTTSRYSHGRQLAKKKIALERWHEEIGAIMNA